MHKDSLFSVASDEYLSADGADAEVANASNNLSPKKDGTDSDDDFETASFVSVSSPLSETVYEEESKEIGLGEDGITGYKKTASLSGILLFPFLY